MKKTHLNRERLTRGRGCSRCWRLRGSFQFQPQVVCLHSFYHSFSTMILLQSLVRNGLCNQCVRLTLTFSDASDITQWIRRGQQSNLATLNRGSRDFLFFFPFNCILTLASSVITRDNQNAQTTSSFNALQRCSLVFLFTKSWTTGRNLSTVRSVNCLGYCLPKNLSWPSSSKTLVLAGAFHAVSLGPNGAKGHCY